MTEESADSVEQQLDVTRETMDGLASKLDTFGEGLSDDERAVLSTVLSAGLQTMSSEVEGFSIKLGELLTLCPTSPLGNEVRRYDIVGAFPTKLEFGQMKAGDSY